MSHVPEYTSDSEGFYYKVPGKAKQGPFPTLRAAMDGHEGFLRDAASPTPKKGKKSEEIHPGHLADSLGSAGESEATDGEGSPG